MNAQQEYPCLITGPHPPHEWTPAVSDPDHPRVLHVDTTNPLPCPGVPLEHVSAAAYAAYLGACYVCDDPTNHGGQPHAEATGDGRNRASVIVDRLGDRLQRAADALGELHDTATVDDERTRLHGKREGVQLALSYLNELKREATQ